MRSVLSFVGLTLLTASACENSEPEVKNVALAELDDYCKQIDQDYSVYSPPRGDWGPGYVFKAEIRGEGEEARLVPTLDPGQEEICITIYPPELITRSPLSPPDQTRSREISAEATLQLLKGVVGDENKAKARLAELNLSDELEIKWGHTSEYKFVLENLFNERGESIPVRRSCFNAVQKIKEDGELTSLWVVTKSIAVDELELTASNEKSGGTGVEFSLAEVLDITADADVIRKSGNELGISETRFVCYQPPMRLADWAPKGTVSGASVNVDVKLDPGGPRLPIASD